MARVVRWTREELRQRESELVEAIRAWVPLETLEDELNGVRFLLGVESPEDVV